MSRKRKPSTPVDVRRGVLDPEFAVRIAEAFLKAPAVTRNLASRVGRFAAADFDTLRRHRPTVTVVTPSTLTGHHEIMHPLPLLRGLAAFQP